MAISSLVLMSGYRFLVNVASSSWSCCEVKCVLCLLCLFVFLLFLMLASLPSSVTTPTPVSKPSVFIPVAPIVSTRPVRKFTFKLILCIIFVDLTGNGFHIRLLYQYVYIILLLLVYNRNKIICSVIAMLHIICLKIVL